MQKLNKTNGLHKFSVWKLPSLQEFTECVNLCRPRFQVVSAAETYWNLGFPHCFCTSKTNRHPRFPGVITSIWFKKNPFKLYAHVLCRFHNAHTGHTLCIYKQNQLLLASRNTVICLYFNYRVLFLLYLIWIDNYYQNLAIPGLFKSYTPHSRNEERHRLSSCKIYSV